MQLSLTRPFSLFLSLPVLLGLCACPSSSSESDDLDPTFRARSTGFATASSSPVVVAGEFFAFLANEATSGLGDLNGDLDSDDDVVVMVDIDEREEFLTEIAAETMEILGTTLFLAVNEEDDGRDWDGDGDQDVDELSLVYWRAPDEPGVFVARLDAESPLPLVKSAADMLFAVLEDDPGGLGQTNLVQLSSSAPLQYTRVMTDAGGTDGLRCDLHGHDEGLIVVTVDEEDSGDLNNDGEDDAEAVLALLDGTTAGEMLISTAYAVDEEPTVRADAQGTGDWIVAFLVDEEEQPEPDFDMGFNHRDLFASTWEPDGCPGTSDTDTDDEVLFFFGFLDFQVDPIDRPIRNTGLVGTDRVVLVDGYVGVISEEEDDGDCDFNGDTDTEDRVLRWVAIELDPAQPLLPVGGVNDLLALVEEDELPGGTNGVAELEGKFVILVDEEADDRTHDDDLADELLLAWLDPGMGGGWDFNQGPSAPGSDEIYVSASWMSESPDRTQLLFAAREEVLEANLNIPSGASGPDMDMMDSVPMFGVIDESEGRLTLPWIRIAVDPTNAGLVLQDGVLFSRFHERDDSRDLTDDGDLNDRALGGSVLTANGTPTPYIGGVAAISGRPVVDIDPFAVTTVGAVFLASEADDGEDRNGDGDMTDTVARYFRF